MTDPGEDLTALRDRLPKARPLPQHSAHRAGLLAVLSAEPSAIAQPRPGWPDWPGVRRWLSPVAAAAVVGAITVAVALPTLLGSTAAPARHAHRQPPGRHLGYRPHRVGLRWQVPLGGLDRVVVRDSAGVVTVRAMPAGDRVIVSATRHFSGRAPAISSTVVAGVLEVRGQCPGGSRRHCSVSFTVLLPRALPVQVHDGLGTVRLDGLSGPVTVTDALGDIDGAGLSSPRASLTDDLGNISVAFAAPPARLVASDQAGNVTITVPGTTAYRVTAQAQLGNTTVSVPTAPGAARIIRASSQLGNVTVTG